DGDITAAFETIALETLAQEIIRAAAEARHADPFPFEGLDILKLRFAIEPEHGSIKTGVSKTQRHAAKNCRQAGATHGSKNRNATDERGYAERVAHHDQVHI